MQSLPIIGLMMLAFCGSASAQRLMKPVPVGNPADWFGPDNYPKEALRANRQGRVVVELGVDSTGAAVTCTVKVTSGTAVLDEGTCAVAHEQARFNPATDIKGRPTSGTYLLPVRWTLPGSQPASIDLASISVHRTQAVEIFISAAGLITSCQVLENVPADGNGTPAMSCPPEQIGRQQVPMTRGGQPIAYKVVSRITTDVVPTEP